MGEPRVRLAKASDVETLVRHRRGMWREIASHSESALDAADPVYRRWITARIKNGRAAAFIVESRGKAVASGVLWIQEAHPRPEWKDTRQGYLLSMFTDPGHRRRGHAEAIVRAALAWAKKQGIERVTLHAAPGGRRIYARVGFTRTHEMRIVFLKPKRRAHRPPRRSA